MVALPLVAYSAYLSFSRLSHPAGPWYDRSALVLALMLGLPFAILLAQSVPSRIVAGALYLALRGLVLIVYTFVFVGIIFDLWL
jgi:hypothetical protein